MKGCACMVISTVNEVFKELLQYYSILDILYCFFFCCFCFVVNSKELSYSYGVHRTTNTILFFLYGSIYYLKSYYSTTVN